MMAETPVTALSLYKAMRFGPHSLQITTASVFGCCGVAGNLAFKL